MNQPWPMLTCAALLLTLAAPVEAQPTEAGVRLGIDLTFGRLEVASIEDEDGDSTDRVSFVSSLAIDQHFLNLGYGLSEALTLGIRANSGSHVTVSDFAGTEVVTNAFQVTGLPYLEVNLSDDGALRPFLGPTLGVSLATFQTRTDVGLGEEESEGVSAAFLIGAFFGARVFIADNFAFEPTLVATYGLTATRNEVDGVRTGDRDTKTFTLMLLVGSSLWFGAEREPAPAPSESAAPPPVTEPFVPPPAPPPSAPPADPGPAGEVPPAPPLPPPALETPAPAVPPPAPAVP